MSPYEGGELVQELQPRQGGPVEYDRGEYLWIFRKGGDGTWRIARIAGAFDIQAEGGDMC